MDVLKAGPTNTGTGFATLRRNDRRKFIDLTRGDHLSIISLRNRN
jgi:hypothetical protein